MMSNGFFKQMCTEGCVLTTSPALKKHLRLRNTAGTTPELSSEDAGKPTSGSFSPVYTTVTHFFLVYQRKPPISLIKTRKIIPSQPYKHLAPAT